MPLGMSPLAQRCLLLPILLLGGWIGFSSLDVPDVQASEDRQTLQEAADRYFSPEEQAAGRAYARPFLGLFAAQSVVTLVFFFWVAIPGRRHLLRATRRLTHHPHRQTAALLALLAVLHGLLRLPFSLMRWVHATEQGMRHDSLLSYLGLWIKGWALDLVLLVVVGWLLWRVLTTHPIWGWVWGWAAVCVLTVGYVTIAPAVIDPLFNNYARLEDRDLEARLLAVAEAGGVSAHEVWVADASRRTRAANASFNGFGGTRRIVVYDTLLEFPEPEVTAILAHEVGHWRRHHIVWGLLFGLGALGPGLWLTSVALNRRLGTHVPAERRDPSLVIPAYAIYLLVMLAVMPVSNTVSRRFESTADRDAVRITGDPAALRASFIRLGQTNRADVLPPLWIERLLYTHPAPARRILRTEEGK